MNILYITNSINMYGSNKSLMDFIGQVDEKKVKPVVLLWDYGEMYIECIKNNIRAYVLPYTLSAHKIKALDMWDKIYGLEKNIALLSEAKNIVEENHIDLIHSNASNVDFGAMLAMVCHLPHIWHIRELLQKDYELYYDFPWLAKFFMKKADKIISISSYVAEQRKLSAINNTILYDGINLKDYIICKKNLFCETKIHILYAGIISHNKGTMDAVKAVHRLVKMGHTNVVLMVAGGESAYWHKMKQYIERNHLEAYIEYYGYQLDLRPLRKLADIAIMSSRSEAMGRVTIESMLGEVLVIGADCGATAELIQNGLNGYLYEPGNSRQLADKILDIYRNVEKSRNIVLNAKRFAIKKFDNLRYMDKLLKIYDECVD